MPERYKGWKQTGKNARMKLHHFDGTLTNCGLSPRSTFNSREWKDVTCKRCLATRRSNVH